MNRWIKSTLMGAALGLFAVGCGNSDEPVVDNTPVAPVPQPQVAAQQAAQPVINQALDNRDYEKATDEMLRSMAKSGGQYDYATMVQLQDEIAKGLARGDPRAIKAQQLMNQIREQMRRQGR